MWATKFHTHTKFRICPVPTPLCMIRNVFRFLRWGIVTASPNSQVRGPPLVCPRLLIQYIRSYPPYLEAVPPSATCGRAILWWQGPTYHWSTSSRCAKSQSRITLHARESSYKLIAIFHKYTGIHTHTHTHIFNSNTSRHREKCTRNT